jgi:DNA repair protein RadA
MSEKHEIDEIEGIGPATLKKLSMAGITTIKEIAHMPPKLLAEIAEIPESKALQISINARKLVEEFFITANEIKARDQKKPILTTGVQSLDNMLLGGIESGILTEIAGEYGSGKTQLCHQLAVTVQLPTGKKGLDGAALYVDTENTFSYTRIESIAKRFELDPNKVLDKIFVAKAFNTEHQIYIIQQARSKIKKDNIKIVIVDSIINHFRSEYPGRETLAIRQQKLNTHLHDLMRLAEIFSIPVIITNQIISSPDTFTQPKHPAGGNVLAHTSSIRIMLEKRANIRTARIIDSPKHPITSANFIITEQGIEDAPNDYEK